MEDQVKTYIQLGDEQVDAAEVEVPDSRTFRNAWVLEGEVIAVDMAQALVIAQDRVRAAREPYLLELDAEYMKATETGADTSEIIAKKQVLRDAPQDPRLVNAQDEFALEDGMNAVIGEFEEL